MKIYLAIPYTFNPDLSHRIANKVAAKLMSEGHTVFSPISHSHHIADHLAPELRTDSHWWMQHDLPFVEWCEQLHVVCIGEFGGDLIAESIGCNKEMGEANELRKLIKIIDYYE